MVDITSINACIGECLPDRLYSAGYQRGAYLVQFPAREFKAEVLRACWRGCNERQVNPHRKYRGKFNLGLFGSRVNAQQGSWVG